MSRKDEVREFLISRRAGITPAEVGLPAGGEDRRVPGLRREEVAVLAGVSTDYYTKLERGKLRTASASVLAAIADALRLDDVERAHLFDLFREPGETPKLPAVTDTKRKIPASVQRVLDGMNVPALVYGVTQDILGANLLGRAMFAPLFDAERPNMARFIFLDSRAPAFYDDWDLACSLTAAMLRYEAGRDPLNAQLTALIGELSTRSPVFRSHWAASDVHEHRTGRKTFHHPAVGAIEAAYDVLELPGEHGISITTYSADPGSPSAEKLSVLASWAASQHLDNDADNDARKRAAVAPKEDR
ncbi:helix-turn-helix transcriptional regulator [Nesterenkonia sp. CL21]|uniref:helix-turn-helix transcriptional regulator n=1 Tax=Nesterenkonia sp. CL21 TaxID=3064894 RepID=UPI0028781CE5|nr:helix-turn-helix transcriptional regulator [Nesterenkonia sp. CL21]MDS2171849.1 helix-turn-helix transcriptional regulator [Nesterenkonia sp. CL21]